MPTEKWQAKLADSIVGVMFLGARKGGRGEWLAMDDVPDDVRSYLGLERLPGAAGRVIMGDTAIRRLDDLEAIIEPGGRDTIRRRGNQATVAFAACAICSTTSTRKIRCS